MKTRRNKLEITESELNKMTGELDDLHHDVGMPALREGIAAWTDELRSGVSKPTSRRLFLFGSAGLVAGGAALAAIGSTPGIAAAATTAANPPNSQGGITGLTGDLAIAALAASLENLAIFAYKSGLAAATAGKLGTVPPAVGTFATTAMNQHTVHAAAWNALLTANGKMAVTVTEPKLTPVVEQKFGQVTDIGGLAELALLLENVAAQTYQVACGAVKSKRGIQVAASIQPVEMQHAAILKFVLAKYPVPNAFNPTNQAA